MRRILFCFMFFVPVFALAGTIQDFFNEHQELNDNFMVRTLISKKANFEAAGAHRRIVGCWWHSDYRWSITVNF